MTRSTTRMAGIGAGALLALGIFTAAPAGATGAAQADAQASLETEEAINQTLGLVNQACGSLRLLGSVAGEVDATRPLQVTCAASASGTGLGLTAAGVDVLVDALAPGVDVSGLNLAIPVVDASASANTSGAAVPADAAVSATAAGTLPATQATAAPSARVSAAAPASTTTASAVAEAAPATTSNTTAVSGGTLARTGAGVGGLGLLGGMLIGGGRLLAFGRRFLGIG